MSAAKTQYDMWTWQAMALQFIETFHEIIAAVSFTALQFFDPSRFRWRARANWKQAQCAQENTAAAFGQ
jgi:hypothetical protein